MGNSGNDISKAFRDVYTSGLWKKAPPTGIAVESHSGIGSELNNTVELRKQLTEIVKEHGIKKIVDIPCGDFFYMGQWMKDAGNALGVEYFGGDIVEEILSINTQKHSAPHITFGRLNAIEDPIPDSDLLIVKDLAVHLPNADILRLLRNIKKSNARYVLLTTFDRDKLPAKKYGEECNIEIKPGQHRHLDLMIEPYRFPMPLRIIEEGPQTDYWLSRNALWRREDIPDF